MCSVHGSLKTRSLLISLRTRCSIPILQRPQTAPDATEVKFQERNSHGWQGSTYFVKVQQIKVKEKMQRSHNTFVRMKELNQRITCSLMCKCPNKPQLMLIRFKHWLQILNNNPKKSLTTLNVNANTSLNYGKSTCGKSCKRGKWPVTHGLILML